MNVDITRCLRCIFFKVHSLFPYLGYCEKRGEVIVSSPKECGDFKQVDLDYLKEIVEKEGSVYCVTCRKPITSIKELEEYMKEHVIVSRTIVDEVVSEETPTAD